MKRNLLAILVLLTSNIGCSSPYVCCPQPIPLVAIPAPCSNGNIVPFDKTRQEVPTAGGGGASLTDLHARIQRIQDLIENESNIPNERGIRQELKEINQKLGAIQQKLP